MARKNNNNLNALWNTVKKVVKTVEKVVEATVNSCGDGYDKVSDLAEDAFDYASDEAIDTTLWLLEEAEKLANRGEDIADEVTAAYTEMWEDLTEPVIDAWGAGMDLADELIDLSDAVWDYTNAGYDEICSSITEAVADAITYIENSADRITDWMSEEAVPWVIACIELMPALVKALGALLVLPLCILFEALFGEEEIEVLRGVCENASGLERQSAIKRLHAAGKYAIFSDVHMYKAGNMDFFNRNQNAAIYRVALSWYSANGYHLIEGGDIEDFWMRDRSVSEAIDIVSDYLPYPYFSQGYAEEMALASNRHLANLIIQNNLLVYKMVRSMFFDPSRYTRLAGNHDDVWSDTRVLRILEAVYPDIQIYDYCALDGKDNTADIVISHGHQADWFNMRLCDFAGKSITNLASFIYEASGELVNVFTKRRTEWEREWEDKNGGFNNELDQGLLTLSTLDEHQLYRDYRAIYTTSGPAIILGHTHNPRDKAGIPTWFKNSGQWHQYSNTGTVGMWESIVCGLESDNGTVMPIAWRKEYDGTVRKYILRSEKAQQTYLRPVDTMVRIGDKCFQLFNPGAEDHNWLDAYLLSLACYFNYYDSFKPVCKCQDEFQNRYTALMKDWGFSDVSHITFSSPPQVDTEAVVVSNQSLVLVVFRGSSFFNEDVLSNISDWLGTNINVGLKDVSGVFGNGAKVHAGFWEAFSPVAQTISDTVKPYLDLTLTGYTQKKLWITGNSLGGALATLCGLWLKMKCQLPVHKIITYSSPRVGNAKFASIYDDVLPHRMQRWVHDHDPVPNLPPELMGYKHGGELIRIDQDGCVSFGGRAYIGFTNPMHHFQHHYAQAIYQAWLKEAGVFGNHTLKVPLPPIEG